MMTTADVTSGFDQLNGQYVYGSDLAGGQLGNLTHRDLAPCQWDSWPVGSCRSWRAAYLLSAHV
jgi:hypothetical protein